MLLIREARLVGKPMLPFWPFSFFKVLKWQSKSLVVQVIEYGNQIHQGNQALTPPFGHWPEDLIFIGLDIFVTNFSACEDRHHCVFLLTFLGKFDKTYGTTWKPDLARRKLHWPDMLLISCNWKRIDFREPRLISKNPNWYLILVSNQMFHVAELKTEDLSPNVRFLQNTNKYFTQEPKTI